MQQYSTFIFDSYTFDPKTGTIELKYGLDDDASAKLSTGIRFTETLTLQRDGLFPSGADPELLDRFLFALHLIGGVSYYKTCCPETIEIRSGKLTEKQAAFWNTVYTKGLGEFFYRNRLDSEGRIRFPASSKEAPKPIPITNADRRVLVPVGGGKDSIVTVDLLRSSGADCVLFRLGSHPLIDALAKTAKLPLITVERKLSPELFRLNGEGAMNGHVPISAYVSFLSTLTALLYGFDFVALSCERSASEGNVEHEGRAINHQWSKSLEFERMFQDFISSFLTPDIGCGSVLRTMSELAIARYCCALPQYFSCITSCNANWRIAGERPRERWCGLCPKCAFAFCQFAAFLPKEELLRIFPKNLYEEAGLLPLYRQLLGLEGCKPFECVGTPEETAAAMMMALDRGELADTPVLQMFDQEKDKDRQAIEQSITGLLTPGGEHAVSPTFLSRLHVDR